MAYLEWKSSYDIGVDIIDQQHRRIGDYINLLDDAIQNNEHATVFEVMALLKDYTFDHFVFEEQLMERAGYPLLDAHMQVHSRFCARLESFSANLQTGSDPMTVARKLRNELARWLINHIGEEDANYAALVRKAIRKEKSWVSAALDRIFGPTTTA